MKRRIRRFAVIVLAVPLIVTGSWFGYKFATSNFAEVVPGAIYRSGQLDSKRLGRLIREKKIKTVLNLRGSHPESEWYRREREATLSAGAVQVDIALSSSEWMSRAQAKALLEELDTAEYPILIHCWRGAERTGLVSAITRLLAAEGSIAAAEGQFSWRYLYFPVGHGVMMTKHIRQYQDWLIDKRLAHSPETFRRWVRSGYRPGSPCREDWPYDPYPVIVVSKPKATATR